MKCDGASKRRSETDTTVYIVNCGEDKFSRFRGEGRRRDEIRSRPWCPRRKEAGT